MMTKGNGKIRQKGIDQLDPERELPESDDSSSEQQDTQEGQAQAAAAPTDEFEAQAEKLRAECGAYLDRLARLQAEFDNFRKRATREQQEYREYALAEALKLLLPILDSLDRALKTGTAGVEDFRSGIDLIDRQFHDVLAKLGVEPVPAKGMAFDPNIHQAVQMMPTNEVPENHVVEELLRGYKLRDRLLRPAMVLVAQKPGS
jgi:molecular chaperone GrpE